MITKTLADFWPPLQSVAETLETQAQAQESAVFLAVHQPMLFEVRPVGSGVTKTRTENELLDALLAPVGPAKTIILPILGDSGVGKSHAVRWLSEQVSHRGEAFHVVWVPRGESLKQTLRRVLNAFEGTQQYSELSKALESAVELPPAEIRGRLRSALVEQLRNPTPELRERVGAQLYEFVEDCGEGLAAVLQDPASSWDHFETEQYDAEGGRGAITRLTRHITSSRSLEDDHGETDRRFVARDLEIAPAIQKEMGKTALDFCGQLMSNEIRALSIALLNEVLDMAKSRSLELGGVDLLDLFRRFRAELQRQKKELVILIEDFTVMSGLQGALYDLMVQTSQPGEEEVCAIRTAFALTPGYMQGHNLPENVRTRAGAEWHVTGGAARSETIDQLVNLTGAYVNAARIGISRLRNGGAQTRMQPSEEMADAERLILDAFGTAPNGHWLFPFNRSALEVLINLYMPHAGYNPRLLLQNVVKPVLEQRALFERGEFPSAETGEAPAAHIGNEIATRVAKVQLPRYFRLVNTWGGNPRRWSEVEQIPRELFLAFGLEPLDGTRPAAKLGATATNAIVNGLHP